MKLNDVLKHYGSAYQFRKQTKMSITNVLNWRRLGYIPIGSQMKIELLSGGALNANCAHAVKNATR